MKVAELIQKLSRMNPDADVVIPMQDTYGDEDNYDVDVAGYDPAGTGDVVLHWSNSQWHCGYPQKPVERSQLEMKIQAMTAESTKAMIAALYADYEKGFDWLSDERVMRIRVGVSGVK